MLIIIGGYVVYYTYNIIHDMFFQRKVSDGHAEVEEEIDISDEASQFHPIEVRKEDVSKPKPGFSNSAASAEEEDSSDNGPVIACNGGFPAKELGPAIGTDALQNVYVKYY
jgi:hypothetical protein